MERNSSKIKRLIEDKRDLLNEIFCCDFLETPLYQILDNCDKSAFANIADISDELEGLESPRFNTATMNSRFALSFIYISGWFQNFAYAMRFNKTSRVNIDEIFDTVKILEFYLHYSRRNSVSFNPVFLSSFDELDKNEMEKMFLDGQFLFRIDFISDTCKLIDSLEKFIYEIKEKESNVRSICNLFSFKNKKNSPEKCYIEWVKAFKCYAMKEGRVNLKERIKSLDKEFSMNDDKRGADYNRRKLAERLIVKALQMRPLAEAHAAPSAYD